MVFAIHVLADESFAPTDARSVGAKTEIVIPLPIAPAALLNSDRGHRIEAAAFERRITSLEEFE